MKNSIYLICFLMISICGVSQTNFRISGKVKNFAGDDLSKATVILFNKTDKDSLKTTTDVNGNYTFTLQKESNVSIRVSYIGYDDCLKEINLNNPINQFLDDIILKPTGKMLSEVTVASQKIQIKEDTIAYTIDSTMYRKNDNVESLLKNLPGVQVDKDGTVTAQGKQVTKVKVNGKDFFNGDVTTATRELNADMVDRIQMIDDYGDQAAFTGIKDGDPSKTMNIILKKIRTKVISEMQLQVQVHLTVILDPSL